MTIVPKKKLLQFAGSSVSQPEVIPMTISPPLGISADDASIPPVAPDAAFVFSWIALPSAGVSASGAVAVHAIKHHVARLTGGGRRIDGTVMDGAWLSDAPIVIEAGAIVEPGAYILGPAYIGSGAVVRHGAYVRENVILLAGSTLGHTSEAKNALFLPGAAAPHFAYVGDSILGHRVNLGAGTKLSNLGILSAKDAATGKRPTIRLVIDDHE